MTTDEAVAVLSGLDPQSDEFRGVLSRLLGRVDPKKPYGATLFDALARLTTSEAVEAVLVRWGADNQLEVYMTQRGSDEAYPNEWHLPGSIYRPGEDTADVMARLSQREFGCKITGWRQVDHFRHAEARGWFSAFVFMLEVEGEPRNARGAWYLVDNLPPNTVRHHVERIIPAATAAFSGQS